MLSSTDEKREFMRKVTILADTREQKNTHILDVLNKHGIMYEPHKLDFGDYSFIADGHDFSCSCVIERKADINEIYGNITTDRERIEKELDTISRNANQCIFLIENCSSWDSLKAYELNSGDMKGNERKVKNIGATVCNTLQAWRCGNRYNFMVEFVDDITNSAFKILELFFWYYHNYKKLTAPRK